ncbi:N-acetylmuramoyl-L-alanine amidase [Thioalkalivibrio sp. ALJT]|uniref:N-acetylmuramoyl-L-alanine amidase n=1 Tax=Thioalkalivibrio sp. ALJT TaxID=1158146 RepID=UPI000686E78C|nr:N-acetylmuramoyl-L-alanine amidase [Thioalkalivibrio sp. ALJT]
MTALGLVGMPLPALARTGVQRVRMSVDGDTTRVVFDMDGEADYSMFSLQSPDRLVVDLDNARAIEDLSISDNPRSVIKAVRHAARNGSDLRVVFDLREPVEPRSFVLMPAQGAPHRLVLDLDAGETPAAPSTARDNGARRGRSQEDLRDVVVAIDAGHGGHDPGAIGPSGTREKDVVLQISRRLAERVDAERGMKAVMTRTGDYFLPLRERIERARKADADVFVSIHADAIANRSVQGSSVYILSERGASSEAARFLAQRENQADLMLGGVPVNGQDDSLANVLLDLAQSGSLEASNTLAERMIGELHRVGKVRRPQVERANFAVLRSPDVPSILVEAAFISNPSEERKLRSASFQNSLADALLTGLRSYFSTHARPGTLIADGQPDQHIIRPGETLSGIADRYSLSLSELRSLNNVRDDRIYAGQVLEIPRGS